MKIFWKLAGVDPTTMEACPWSDRFYAALMGVVVVASSIGIFILTFDALEYIVPEGSYHTTATLFFSLLITTLVTAQNTAALNKAWVDRESTLWQRLLMALLLVAMLGALTLISFFHSEIASKIDEIYRQDNAALYQQANKAISDYDMTHVKPYEERLLGLQEKFNHMKSEQVESSTGEFESVLESFAERKHGLEREIKDSEQERNLLGEEKKDATTAYKKASELFQCEKNGWGEVMFGGETLYCSDTPGMGSRANGYRKDMAQALASLDEIKKRRLALETRIARLKDKRMELIAKSGDIKREMAKLKHRKNTLVQLQAEIDQVRHDLEKAKRSYQLFKEKAYEDIKESPDYRPLKKDLIAQFRALIALLSEEKTMLYFAIFLSIGIVYFELMPILIKIFYAPRSMYSMLQRKKMDLEEEWFAIG